MQALEDQVRVIECRERVRQECSTRFSKSGYARHGLERECAKEVQEICDTSSTLGLHADQSLQQPTTAKKRQVDPVARIGDPAPVAKRFAAPVTRTGEQDGKHSPDKCYMISQLGLIYNHIFFYILLQKMILPELHHFQTKISARFPIASSTENCEKLWSDCLLQRTRCKPWKIKCMDLNAEKECTKNAVQEWWGPG